MSTRERVARNFIKRYGMARFRKMIAAFGENRSGQEIATTLGVSRERVRQWKRTFGQTITLYRLYPETKSLLNGAPE
jgi:DNA-directed RNA polymerase sigma subunit (sigma70/sigma32)